MGLFGSSAKISSAQSSALSGVGAFAPTNSISINHSLFDLDFDSPEKLAGLLVVVGAGLWAWRKMRV
jgi:hypothetical protein